MDAVLVRKIKIPKVVFLRLAASLVLFLGAISFLAAPRTLHAQVPEQVDPFYKNLLEEGKTLYLKGDLEGSAKCLEIAFFGYLDFPAKVLECYVYLLIDRYGLKNVERAGYYRAEIRRLNLERQFPNLSLPPEIKAKYDGINAAFARVEASASGRPSAPPTQIPTAASKAALSAQKPLSSPAETAAQPRTPAPAPAKTEFLPDDVPSLIKLTEGALADLHFEKAYQAMMKAIKLDNENIQVRYLLGRANFGLKRYKEAVAEFEVVLARSPGYKDTEAWKKVCADRIKQL
jgi:tetratricopeptide (TPR) repeat protein